MGVNLDTIKGVDL